MRKINSMNDILEIEDVSKAFGSVVAVDNLSIHLPAGCIYGFLGPNGAGKTTTIRMIMDIIRPDSGRIVLLGESEFRNVRDRVGYLPEERGLYRKMKVRDIITYIASIKGMTKNAIARALPLWLDKMELSDWAGKKTSDLSRGMQQKLQFIIAVIHDPELIILDEPFSGLDPINLELIKNFMTGMRDNGKTVIFSTHMMEQAEKLCDYLLLIDRGKKVLDGTLDEIRSHYSADMVSVELDGDMAFIERLPHVRIAKCDGRRMTVTLDENADTQAFLHELAARHRIRSFEVKAPSLHEIFINTVGKHDR
jgi:ABC-2 type transport system ATP-binding protein